MDEHCLWYFHLPTIVISCKCYKNIIPMTQVRLSVGSLCPKRIYFRTTLEVKRFLISFITPGNNIFIGLFSNLLRNALVFLIWKYRHVCIENENGRSNPYANTEPNVFLNYSKFFKSFSKLFRIFGVLLRRGETSNAGCGVPWQSMLRQFVLLFKQSIFRGGWTHN